MEDFLKAILAVMVSVLSHYIIQWLDEQTKGK